MSRMDTGKVTGDPLESIPAAAKNWMPRRDILTFREEHKDDLEVRLSYEDLYREIDLSRVDNPPEEEVASSVEMNTNNTGKIWVTRIRMKQAPEL